VTAANELSCHQVVRLVTEYLEQTLPGAERIAFEEHVAVCFGCRSFLCEIRLTVGALDVIGFDLRQAEGWTDEPGWVEALRRGEPAAFDALRARYQHELLRLARQFVPNQAVAEEVVQETWLGVLKGIGRFEGRSSLKTWLFRILTNRARTRGERESRTVPFSSLPAVRDDGEEAALDADDFAADAPTFGAIPDLTPEQLLLSRELRRQIVAAIQALPPRQQLVITLRDVDGWSAEETCAALGLTEANQRVLLHRARTAVRRAIAAYHAPA